MVKELFKNVVENEYLLTNMAHLKCLQEEMECQCSHLPIFLGESTVTFILNDGKKVPKPHKRCLLCGQDVSLYPKFDYEFDARKYLNSMMDPIEDLDEKYFQTLQIFKEICRQADTIEEAYKAFNRALNNISYQKILKKPTKK